MKKGIIWKIIFVFIFCISLSYSKGKSTENRNNREITEKNVTQISDYAYELYKKGNLSESKKILEDILNKFPKRIVANLNYADVLWKLGEKTKAEKFYTEYIKLLIKSDKLEKNLINDKSIKFANGITLKETKSGYINKDNKKDYILEYSNIETEKAYIFGGGMIYSRYFDKCDEMFITEVDTIVEADTKFPDFDESEWELISRENFSKDEYNEFNYSFIHYIRRRKE